MKAEILCIGTELLLGETVNTNATFIAKKLTEMGIDCHFVTTVGDNSENIMSALEVALKRTNIIIITGGLGPTADDITIETVAQYFNAPLILDKKSQTDLINYFNKLNKKPSASNFKQALRPSDAQHIENPTGTAPGLLWELKNTEHQELNSPKTIMCFPGVPSELYAMWNSFTEPYLAKLSQNTLITEHLKFSSIPESLLAEKVHNYLEQTNPTVAPLVKDGEATLRIAAKAQNKKNALSLIKETKNKILKEVGEFYYASDNETIEEVISKLLNEKSLVVATAESCTGGLISSRLTDIAGSSAFIKLNLVTYSNEAKMKMLNVKESTLTKYGAVSEQTAIEMAEGIRNLSNCDIGLSVTGVAGPDSSEQKPVGLVYIGISNNSKTIFHKIMHSSGHSRTNIKFASSQKALQLLRQFILAEYF